MVCRRLGLRRSPNVAVPLRMQGYALPISSPVRTHSLPAVARSLAHAACGSAAMFRGNRSARLGACTLQTGVRVGGGVFVQLTCWTIFYQKDLLTGLFGGIIRPVKRSY